MWLSAPGLPGRRKGKGAGNDWLSAFPLQGEHGLFMSPRLPSPLTLRRAKPSFFASLGA